MSNLRKQLDAMKAEYRCARYPGNLATDMLTSQNSSRMSVFRVVSYVAVPLGMAAALFIWLGHRPASQTSTQPAPAVAIAVKPAATTPSTPNDEKLIPVNAISTELTFPSMQLSPSISSLVPQAPSLDFGSPPSMPSMDVDFENSSDRSSTTKESV